MKRYLSILLFVGFQSYAWSKEITVKLSVPSMNCITCPITVKKALEKVDGVQNVSVNFKKKLAVIRYDDEKTSITALIEATKNAGFPSKKLPEEVKPL